MLTHSQKDRSRSPHRTNGTANISSQSSSSRRHSSTAAKSSNENETSSKVVANLTDGNMTTSNNNSNNNTSSKSKKENESQLRMKSLRSFIQTFINDSSADLTSDEQMKTIENASTKEFDDIPIDRIRRMIRSVIKSRQSSNSATNSFLQQNQSNILPILKSDSFNSSETTSKTNRSNSASNNHTTKNSDLVTPTLSPFDADFLRHAFSQQFRPQLDLSAYFTGPNSNGTNPTSTLFRPNFSSSNFLQSLTAQPPPIPTALVSSHTHTNGSNEASTANINKSSKQIKLSNNEVNSIRVLVNAYREAASYLNRSADELEQLM